MKKAEYLYDVFISHAVEDKIAIANDLFKALDSRGLKVWYSGNELSVGDKLVESIHDGLDQCRFGVVIISPTYISKIWALHEFFFLLKREDAGHKVILPVLYNITPEELAAQSIVMANMFAIRAEKGLDHVADYLVREMSKQRGKPIGNKTEKPSLKWLLIVLMFLVSGGLSITVYNNLLHSSADTFVQKAIETRISEMQRNADDEIKLILQKEQAVQTTIEKVQKMYADYINIDSHYRNEYTLNTGREVYQSKKRVSALLGPVLEDLTPMKNFNFGQFTIFQSANAGDALQSYVVLNLEYPAFKIEKKEDAGGNYTVHVRYKNNIRMIYTSLIFPATDNDTKRFHETIVALLPEETFHFVKKHGNWVLERID